MDFCAEQIAAQLESSSEKISRDARVNKNRQDALKLMIVMKKRAMAARCFAREFNLIKTILLGFESALDARIYIKFFFFVMHSHFYVRGIFILNLLENVYLRGGV